MCCKKTHATPVENADTGGGALSFECAARVHEFDRARGDVVEFTVPRSQRSPSLGFRVHSTIVLPDIDCVTIDGGRRTSATRTIIDLAAAQIGRVRLEAAIDSAIRSEASSPALLAERLDALRGPGRHGVRLLAGLLEDTGGHTMLERRFLQLMRSTRVRHVGGRHDEIGDGHPHDARAVRLRPPSSRRLTVLVQATCVGVVRRRRPCFR